MHEDLLYRSAEGDQSFVEERLQVVWGNLKKRSRDIRSRTDLSGYAPDETVLSAAPFAK